MAPLDSRSGCRATTEMFVDPDWDKPFFLGPKAPTKKVVYGTSNISSSSLPDII